MIFTPTTGLQIAKGASVSKSINNIHRDEKLHLFQLYILSKYQPITEGRKLQHRLCYLVL